MENEPIRVAVYGTLLAGERNSRVAADAIDRRPCRLRGTLYDPRYGFPAFVPGGRGEFAVAGELLAVDAATFARLDRLEGYPNFYGRRRVPVLLDDGTRVNAWVYVMRNLPANVVPISGGDWRAYAHGR